MPISDSRELVGIVGHALSLLLLILLLPQRRAQDIPMSQNGKLIREHEQETFLNSHIVEKELEKSVYLYKGISKNFTFPVDKTQPIQMTVTPCASEITWLLRLIPKRKRGAKRLGQSLSRRKRPAETLTQCTSDSRETFYTSDSKAGVYILTITSLYSDSYVKIHVTLKPALNIIYPQLPTNPTVTATAHKRKLILNWPSGNAANHWRRTVEYCVTISRIKNFRTHCAALAFLHGDKRPKFPRWGFPHEKEMFQRQRQMAKPIKRASRKLIFHECVGNKTTFTYKKLRPGKKYFVDVFITDKDTNTASTYMGVTLKTKPRKKKSKYAQIRVDQTKTVNLRKKKGIELKVKQTLPVLVFELVPCSGKASFEILYNKKQKERRGMIRRWRRIVLKKPKAGTYLLTFPGLRKRSSVVTVHVASKVKNPKIVFPRKVGLKVHESRTTCSNVTVEWMGVSSEQEYCVYKTPVAKAGRVSRKHSCLSPKERKPSELGFCTRHAAREKTDTETHTLTGLKANTHYQLDLYVGTGATSWAPYKSVLVQTSHKCPK